MENRPHIAIRFLTLLLASLLLVSGAFAPVAQLESVQQEQQEQQEETKARSEEDSQENTAETSISQWEVIATANSVVRFVPVFLSSDWLPLSRQHFLLAAAHHALKVPAVAPVFIALLEYYQIILHYIAAPNAP